jgi:hypothetical protein
VDDSACNLASLNLDEVPAARTARSTPRRSSTPSTSCCLAQEIVVSPSSYPGPRRSPPQRAGVPPARPGLRQPRRAADVERPGLRLGRRPARSPPRSPRCDGAARTASRPRSPAAMGPYEHYEKNRDPTQPRDAASTAPASYALDPSWSRGAHARGAALVGSTRCALGERARLPQRAGHGAGRRRGRSRS